MAFNSQDIDDAIGTHGNNPGFGAMLIEFRELRNWSRQLWISDGEPHVPPETIRQAIRNQKEDRHGRPRT